MALVAVISGPRTGETEAVVVAAAVITREIALMGGKETRMIVAVIWAVAAPATGAADPGAGGAVSRFAFPCMAAGSDAVFQLLFTGVAVAVIVFVTMDGLGAAIMAFLGY